MKWGSEGVKFPGSPEEASAWPWFGSALFIRLFRSIDLHGYEGARHAGAHAPELSSGVKGILNGRILFTHATPAYRRFRKIEAERGGRSKAGLRDGAIRFGIRLEAIISYRRGDSENHGRVEGAGSVQVDVLHKFDPGCR